MSSIFLLGGKLVLVRGRLAKRWGRFWVKMGVSWASAEKVLGAICNEKSGSLGIGLGS